MKLDNMNFNLTGNEITLRAKEDVTAKTGSVLKNQGAFYDENARLLFLFDVSGSMTSRVAADKSGKTFVDQFLWNDQQLAQIRIDATAAISRINGAMLDPFAMQMGDEIYAKLADPQPGPNGEVMFTCTSDQDLKERIVRADMMLHFGINIDFAKQHQQPPTRIELVKKLAKQEIKNRFNKFPKSVVSVVPFSGHPVTLFDGQEPENLWPALESLDSPWQIWLCPTCHKSAKFTGYGQGEPTCGEHGPMKLENSDGGTDILAAVRRAMDLCRHKPSPIGIHHIILVTDGQDYTADSTIGSWVPAMKASGVVLDYIHIGEAGYANQGVKAACEALGGEYVVVNSERDFSEKFIAAVNRLMLPPAAAK